jgi:lipopolysaccharide/colanic/teichoic acid biosynthesis glycosyltransferase
MVENAAGIGPAVTGGGDRRITRVGKLLRKYKLDELPQLFNVIKGEISLVGPRPEVESYVRMFQDDYEQILQIKPGITDYAALEYRDEEEILAGYDDMEEGYIREVLPAKISLYKEYMGKMCFLEDVKIIFKTFVRII